MPKRTHTKLYISIILLIFLIGILVGGYLFSQTQPRSLLSLHTCTTKCFSSRELYGLLASVGIQKFGNKLPLVIKETDKTIVIQHPFPEARIHYVIIPKKDIKNIAELNPEDNEYLIDAFQVARSVIEEQNLQKTRYSIVTNGEGYQQVAYLHFHLLVR